MIFLVKIKRFQNNMVDMFKSKILAFIILSTCTLLFAENQESVDIYPEPSQNKNSDVYIMRTSCDMREASIWIMARPNSKLEISSNGKTSLISTNSIGTATVKFNALKPNTEYPFTISYFGLKNVVTSGKVKTIPDYEKRTPTPNFKFAIIGKVHTNDATFDEPFKTPGGEYEIFTTIKNQNPDAIIWANNGATFRTADWGSKSGMQARYRAERENPALKELLMTAPNYAVIGEGSYGAPNSDKNLWNKKDSISAFKSFWNNPSFGIGSQENLASFFRYGDAEVFLLDDVTMRNNLDYKNSRPEMLGEQQLNWLLTSLKKSNAKFKIVVCNSPITNPVDDIENFAFYKRERKDLLDFINENKIGGVIFISAKKDYAEITRMVRAGAHDLVEITAGPTTARPAKSATEVNFFRAIGSLILERSFATITFLGDEEDRQIKIDFFNSKGKNLLTQTIKASDLYKFE